MRLPIWFDGTVEFRESGSLVNSGCWPVKNGFAHGRPRIDKNLNYDIYCRETNGDIIVIYNHTRIGDLSDSR